MKLQRPEPPPDYPGRDYPPVKPPATDDPKPIKDPPPIDVPPRPSPLEDPPPRRH